MEEQSVLLNTFQENLPSADFSIDSSGDEDEPLKIFSRSNYTNDNEEGSSSPVSSEQKDIVVEDIEIMKGTSSLRRHGNEDEEWNMFQAQFQSALDSSEVAVQESMLAGQIQRMKDEVLMNVVKHLQVSPQRNEASLTTDDDSALESHSPNGQSLLLTDNGSRSTVLRSSCFDGINESELDMALEAIKEESREGTPAIDESSFQWQPLIAPDAANDQLMSQLENASLSQKQEVEKYRSLFAGNSLELATEQKSGTSNGTISTTVHLDLRPSLLEESTSASEMSQSAKRLMALRLSGKKSSVEDGEEDYDLHSWKMERQKYKTSLVTAGTATARKPTDITSTAAETVVANGIIRDHLKSSDSISEDDVFRGQEGSSEKEETSSPTKPLSSGRQEGKSKKKKRKGHKGSGNSTSGSGSGSGSDVDSKGRPRKEQKSSKSDQKTAPKSSNNRNRKDSLTQSSDDELMSKRNISFPVGRSLSEGDSESVVKNLERIKFFLQQKIESRKPPSLFSTPDTPPLFHQDVSFTEALLSTHPFLSTHCLLLLPLTENGALDMDTADLPSNTLDQTTTHFLHLLLLTWLISLTDEQSDSSLWKPFYITGLQQTIVDGLVYLIVSVANNTSVTSCDIPQLLKQSNLGQIIDPLLPSLDLSLSNELLTELKSIASISLSCMFTLQSDLSLLSTPLSFYPHSFYNPRCLPTQESFRSTAPIQTTVCTIDQSHLNNTQLVFALLYEATIQGLDIAGIRLTYRRVDAVKVQLTLAVAFRGSNAISRATDIIGPEDHSLALVTDPRSLSARYGHQGNGTAMVTAVHSQYWAGMELAKWFGGRACLKSGSIIGVSDAITKSERRKRQRVRFSESESEEPPPLPEDLQYPPLTSNRPAVLVYPYSRTILVASPLVTPLCYSTLLDSVAQAGFDLLGVKRIRLNSKRALSLGVSLASVNHFTPSSTPLSPAVGESNDSSPLSATGITSQSCFPPLPSLLLILGRENANLHVNFLQSTISSSLRNLATDRADVIDAAMPISALVHFTEFTEDALKVIGSFTFAPSTASGVKPSSVLLEEKGHKEEISFVAIPGHSSFGKILDTLDILTAVKRPGAHFSTHFSSVESEQERFGCLELLGIKVVPCLSRFQAKQLSPYAQGSTRFQESVDYLSAKPLLLLVLRGINSSERVWKLLKGSEHQIETELKSLDVICFNDMNKAFHLTSLFFIDKELFTHSLLWACSQYVPPTWLNDCAILSGLAVDPDPLLSVFTVTLSQMTLLVKVLEKLSRSGFCFVGLSLMCAGPGGDTHSESILEVSKREKSVAVCVERYNAVWYLAHQLQHFIQSSVSYAKAIYYSRTFMSAVTDVQSYFPFGVHSSSAALLKYYQVSSAPRGTSLSPASSPRAKNSNQRGQSSSVSPLSEDAYLILPPSFMLMSSPVVTHPFITVLDILTRAKFAVIDMFLSQLKMDSAREICSIIDTTIKESELMCGPCLIIGVRRDNACSCFHSIISSSLISCGIREDTTFIAKLFQELLVTGTAQQSAAVKVILKST